MHFLFKEEPTNYSYDAFAKDGKATWTGVKNPVAQRNLRGVKQGDLVFYYHTGNEKQIVGIAKAAGDAYPERPNSVPHVVDLVPVRKLKRPVTLKEIKADKRFEKFALTYMPRLSVMPVEAEWWEAIIAMSEKPLS